MNQNGAGAKRPLHFGAAEGRLIFHVSLIGFFNYLHSGVTSSYMAFTETLARRCIWVLHDFSVLVLFL